MINRALTTEITHDYGSNMIGRVEGDKRYKLEFDTAGDFRFQLWVVDEFTNKHLAVINRIAEVTTGHYRYAFLAPTDAIIEFKLSGNGIVSNIVLTEA